MYQSKPHWTEEEKDYLFSLLDEYRGSEIVKRFQAHAARKGWVSRSETSIRHYCVRNKLSMMNSLNNWNIQQLADLLGLQRNAISYWIKKGYLEAPLVVGSNRIRKISTRALLRMAQKRPELLLRCNRDGLEFIFEPETLSCIESLAKNKRPIPNDPLRIYDRKTGLTYPSMLEASRGSGVSCMAIRRHLRGRLRHKTPRWVLVS